MTEEDQSTDMTSEDETAAAAAEEQHSPKQRRQRSRSAKPGDAKPARTPEQRAADRAEKRRKAAASRTRWRAAQREKRRAASPGTGTPPAERVGTGSPRVRQGIVVSDKGDKTIVVAIAQARQHRTYGKIVRTSSKLHAHDERNEAGAGDTVRVVESRPLSAAKRWRLVEIMERAR